MSSIGPVSNLNAISVLTGTGGPIAKTASQLPQSLLDSASPSDLADISSEALSLQQTDALFGDSSQNLIPTWNQASAGNQALTWNQALVASAYGLLASTHPAAPASPQAVTSGKSISVTG